MYIGREYAVMQYYRIEIAPDKIDEALEAYSPLSYREELSTRFHRMYEAIVNNEVSLRIIQEYLILNHHDTLQENGSYIKEAYGSDNFTFLDILKSIRWVFIHEDKEWIMTPQYYEENEIEREYDDFVDPLYKAFVIEETGFEVIEATKHRVVDTPQQKSYTSL